MGISHLVRVGQLGQIGRFSSPDGRQFVRDDNVICRTDRGLESGIVVCPLEAANGFADSDGQLLRRVTREDQLILDRIDRFRDKAFNACNKLLKDHGLNAVLVDVEHLFDGQSLFFYFLGNVPAEVHDLTDQLAAEYEKKVRFRKFTETMANGCGPDCGTEGSGCASGGCSSCAVSGSCKTSKV